MPNLPIARDGISMVCSATTLPEVEQIRSSTCETPWQPPCVSKPPAIAQVAEWSCSDCSGDRTSAPAGPGDGDELIAAINCNKSISEEEKVRRHQELLAGSKIPAVDDDGDAARNEILGIIDKNFTCSVCKNPLDRPVSAPCGHWTEVVNKTCEKCWEKMLNTMVKQPMLNTMAKQPKINYAIGEAIPSAKISNNTNSDGPAAPYHYPRNDERAKKAFKTKRVKSAGKANASSGQIFVTIAPDHFGPILAAHDPKRNIGVRVGDKWEDRLECRQWGVHFPPVAGIAGQSRYGAQSVVLSGGYADDEDHGEWFLYTGSGGRGLTRNKNINQEQSFDQQFKKRNEALRISCLMGYPVRVVRSHKEPSSYAPEYGVRYDGIYRIEKCWRKVSIQGKFKVCRYLFVRCDNEPAPWTSDNYGDRPTPLPEIKELKDSATDITERMRPPHWDYDNNEGWKWMLPPPTSKKPILPKKHQIGKQMQRVRKCDQMSETEKLMKGLSCFICNSVIKELVTAPCCGYKFCKTCLFGLCDGQSSMREQSCGGRTLRPQKIVKKCPSCRSDICDFLVNPQINGEIIDVIQCLQQKVVEEGDPMKNKKRKWDNAANNEITHGFDDDLVNTDAKIPVSIGLEIKEQSVDSNMLEADAKKENSDIKIEMTTTGLVLVQEDKVVADPKEAANEEIEQTLKRKTDTEIEARGAKMINTDVMEEEPLNLQVDTEIEAYDTKLMNTSYVIEEFEFFWLNNM